jgi:hypothetical protein
MTSIADEIEYKLDNVEVATIRPDDINKTFRSTCIGMNLYGLIILTRCNNAEQSQILSPVVSVAESLATLTNGSVKRLTC